MKGNPLFSLLVANFNNRKYLDMMLGTVRGQTYANWEMLVVDDGSTDDSMDALTSWSRDPRITVIRHSCNRGAGAAFATAAAAASGEIMGMLGADDGLRADALEKMVEAHSHYPGASLINSDLVVCSEDLQPKRDASPYGPVPAGESLIRNCCVSSFATFKRSAYLKTPGFDPSFQRAVDHDMYLKLEEVGSLSYVPEPLYFYRTHSGGISQGSDNGLRAAQFALLARANAYRRRLGTTLPNLTRHEYREIMSTYHRRQADLGFDEGRLASLRHLGRSAAYRPILGLRPSFWGVAARHLFGLGT